MKKRTIATILATMMAVSMLAGCGSSSETPAKEQKTEEAKAPEQTQEAAASDVDWPNGAINFINPSAAGGETDVYGRLFNRYFEKKLGTSCVTTNMPGGGGTISTTEVAGSAADGQTALIFHNGFIINSLMGMTDLNIDSFEIAGIVCEDATQGFYTRADAPYDTIAEMVEYVKGGGEVSVATEVGSFTHFQILALEKAADVELTLVDAGTTTEKIAAMLAGNVDILGTNNATMADYVTKGDMKCLGTLTEERLDCSPDVPTFKEQGYDVVFTKFFFIAFPGGTDKAIVDKASQTLVEIANDPAYVEELAGYNATPVAMTAEEATAYMKQIETEYAALLQ